MQRNLTVLAALTALAAGVFAASENDDPKPTPTSAQEGGMPLALYKSLRGKLVTLSELAESAAAPSPEMKFDAEGEVKKPNANAANVMSKLCREVHANEASILQALSAPRSIQRELAARVLSLAEDKKTAAAALCKTLELDTDADVRSAAAFTLGRLADAYCVERLIKSLNDDSDAVRMQCAIALGLIQDERAVPELMRALRYARPPLLRVQAALSLGRIKTAVKTDELSELLDAEMDERVKMTIAAALRVITGTEAPEISDIPGQADYQKQLVDLSGSMKTVEQKMRDDRHDEIVQVDQKDIEDKLNTMINDLEKMQQMQPKPRDEKQNSKRRMAIMTGEQQSGQKPAKPGSKPPPEPGDSKLNAGKVLSAKDNWATLPAAERDELLQVFRPEVPLRWRHRLEAYFVSIAAEEVKSRDK